jgi:hypothetical protein
MFTWRPILIASLGSLLFASGFIVRLLRRRGASTERTPTLLETMHQVSEEERSA